MAKRKPISKKIRFEVFKRDKFTCQYCGQMAPDVILEVDHIKPVAEGGDNEMVNLITSCRDCNRGKGKRKLSENDELKKQQNALEELAVRREQAEMMAEWRQSLANMDNELAEKINEYIWALSGSHLSESGKRSIRKLVKEFSFDEVMNASETAFDYYYDGSDRSWEKAFGKIGGICYNNRKTARTKTITITLLADTIDEIEREMAEQESQFDNISDYISDELDLKYFFRRKDRERDGDI